MMAFLRRKTTLHRLIFLSALVLTAIVYAGSMFVALMDRAPVYRANWRQAAETEAKYAYLNLKEGKESLVVQRLNESVQANRILFFILKKDGKDVAFGSPGGDRPQLLMEGQRLGEFLDFPDDELAYVSFQANEYVGTVGVGMPTALNFYIAVFKQYKWTRLIELILFALSISIAAYFSLKELTEILRQLRTPGRKRFDPRPTRSQEGETLARGLAGYEAQASELSIENKLLEAQVLSGLKREIDSGRAAPYDFECALVRTDVNDFTKIFSSHKAEDVMDDVNAFFWELTSIVARYGGYLYEFIGDEAIFYFKDEDWKGSSSAAALSAIRDINAAAARIDERTARERGYRFFVKSSVARGRLRFGKQVRNYSLAGAPLIETVRILSHVSEKLENKVYFLKEVADEAAGVCSSVAGPVVTLKGLPGERELFQYVGHKPLAEVLDASNKSEWSLVKYYRSDEDVAALLDYLRENVNSVSAEKFIGLMAGLRDWRAENAAAESRASHFLLLEQLTRLAKTSADGERYSSLLATAAMATMNVVPRAQFDGEAMAKIKSLLRSDDMRVVANALDVFAYFDPANEDVLFNHLLNHKNNRIVANVLVKEGKRGFTKQIAKQLESMLESKNPYFAASGLFALGEVAAHYARTDRIYFSSHVQFQRLIERGFALSTHENEMVRRQAELLKRKLGSMATDAA